jgi:hypothetical protein
MNQRRPAEVRSAEVRPVKVRPAEVRPVASTGRRFFDPPFVPSRDALPEEFEMSCVGH